MSILSFFSKLFKSCDCEEEIKNLTLRVERLEALHAKTQEPEVEKEVIIEAIPFKGTAFTITEEIYKNGLILFNDTDEDAGLYSLTFLTVDGDGNIYDLGEPDSFIQLYDIVVPANGSAIVGPFIENPHWKLNNNFSITVDTGSVSRYGVKIN